MPAARRLIVSFDGVHGWPREVSVWAMSPTIYWPAETPEIGPVRM